MGFTTQTENFCLQHFIQDAKPSITIEPYFEINREEQQLEAVLFHLLQVPANLDEFLKRVGCNWPIVPKEFGIYCEYSYLRDLWHAIGKEIENNPLKRRAIIAMLRVAGATDKLISKLTSLEDQTFNHFFTGLSTKTIRAPSNWQLRALVESIKNDNDAGELLAACKVKWAFKCEARLGYSPRPETRYMY